jgi:hypothetical protein
MVSNCNPGIRIVCVDLMFRERSGYLAAQLRATPTLFAELVAQSQCFDELLEIPLGSSRLLGEAYVVLHAVELQLPEDEMPDNHLNIVLMPLLHRLYPEPSA